MDGAVMATCEALSHRQSPQLFLMGLAFVPLGLRLFSVLTLGDGKGRSTFYLSARGMAL